MDEASYWWEQALKYKERAKQAADKKARTELLDLGAVCEEVAETLESRAGGG